MKPIAKATVPVILGVLAAGILMYQFREIELIDRARRGYDM